MELIYKTLRMVLTTVVLLALLVPAALYVVLSLPGVQAALAERGRRELTELLGVPVGVGRAEITPFNKLTLHDVSVAVAPGDTALRVGRLGAGVRIGKLLRGRIVFSYAEVIGLDLRLRRDSAGAPLNIQAVLDHLQPRDRSKPPRAYSLAIDNIVVRRSRVSYDVDAAPPADARRLDPNHLKFSDIKADIRLPQVSNDGYVADLRRLAATERSGLTLNSLSGRISVADTLTAVEGLHVELPATVVDFAPMALAYDGWEALAALELRRPLALATLEGSHVAPADLAPLLPPLAALDEPIAVDLQAHGRVDSIAIDRLALTADAGAASFVVEEATVAGLPRADSLAIVVAAGRLRADGHRVAALLRQHSSLPARVAAVADTLGAVDVAFDGGMSPQGSRIKLTAATGAGGLGLTAKSAGTPISKQGTAVEGTLTLDGIEAGALAGVAGLGRVSATGAFDATLAAGRRPVGRATVAIDQASWQGNDIGGISADVGLTHSEVAVAMVADDPLLKASGTASYGLRRDSCAVAADLRIDAFCPGRLGLLSKERFADHSLSGRVEVALHGREVDALDGRVELTDMLFAAADGSDALNLDHLTLMMSCSATPRLVMLHSDVADAQLQGSFQRVADVAPALRAVAADVFPALVGATASDEPEAVDMALDVQLRQNATTDRWLAYFGVPLRLLRPVSVQGRFNSATRLARVNIDAPNLLNGNKFIDSTRFEFALDGMADAARLLATTVYPTKGGPATISLTAGGGSDTLNVSCGWDIERERTFNGAVELGARFSRLPDAAVPGAMATAIDVRPSAIVINDTVWRVHPAAIEVAPDRRIAISDFEATRGDQYVKINGAVGADTTDVVCVELHNIDLDYVFGTLDIAAAMFGGVASGKLYASGLLGREPRLEIPRLDVADMTYQRSPFGQTVITSYWDNASRGIVLKADITGPEENHSYVDGAIFPMADSLDFRFSADRLNVGFMHHYMEAFTSEVTGRASGQARLYGTFKLLDMTGDIFADDLRMKVDYTNTYYHATDTIHLTPGRISFSDVALTDDLGNRARLNGWVTHQCFKRPEFEFRISDASHLLCYDTNERINPDWYGRVFCNGSAFIKGVPGFIDINVNMSTSTGSAFTFVLSDTEAAGEYTFLAFRDREERPSDLLLNVVDPQEAALRQLKEQIRRQQEQEGSASVYRINLQVDANPQAEMILVMDPVGGDRIRARGNGNLRMEYNSTDEELRMFGTYALTQGSYNFTLQDIIIKDFTIKEGSSISFHGDPYEAVLDINAIYSVNANLSDLDESFLQDKDLNRTNVPVHALLKVAGDMLQPDISFDLEFPTLTQDTYRKVRSIVSTDDMMNRQIIYLLALNRFYTPDYMASTTKGNELVSVASSTISSQLGSMLGQLSDKWTVAPQFRSDRGDFSDMEVDLALSSYLLDNRLLFNGNFGYRDKSLNNNSFIGDFDLEYLLNKSGNVRLKAYNRYNDQNYYVKSALTTQGVGIVFKRDFDDILSFWKRWRRRRAAKSAAPAPAPTVQPAPAVQAPPAVQAAPAPEAPAPEAPAPEADVEKP